MLAGLRKVETWWNGIGGGAAMLWVRLYATDGGPWIVERDDGKEPRVRDFTTEAEAREVMADLMSEGPWKWKRLDT